MINCQNICCMSFSLLSCSAKVWFERIRLPKTIHFLLDLKEEKKSSFQAFPIAFSSTALEISQTKGCKKDITSENWLLQNWLLCSCLQFPYRDFLGLFIHFIWCAEMLIGELIFFWVNLFMGAQLLGLAKSISVALTFKIYDIYSVHMFLLG